MENIATIITSLAILAAAVGLVISLLKKGGDGKKEQEALTDLVIASLPGLVVQAEKEYPEEKAGSLKKDWVLSQALRLPGAEKLGGGVIGGMVEQALTRTKNILPDVFGKKEG